MKKSIGLILIAGIAVFLMTACQSKPNFVGRYHTVMPSDNSPGRDIVLMLNEDGTHSLTTDMMDGSTPIVERGHWQTEGDTAIVILEETNDEVRPAALEITFEMQDNQLVAIDWNPPDMNSYVGLRLRKEG